MVIVGQGGGRMPVGAGVACGGGCVLEVVGSGGSCGRFVVVGDIGDFEYWVCMLCCCPGYVVGSRVWA